MGNNTWFDSILSLISAPVARFTLGPWGTVREGSFAAGESVAGLLREGRVNCRIIEIREGWWAVQVRRRWRDHAMEVLDDGDQRVM